MTTPPEAAAARGSGAPFLYASAGDAAASGADRALERQAFYLKAIAQIGRTLATVGTLEQLLPLVADFFSEIAGVRWTLVYLSEPGTDTYVLRERKVVLADAGWDPPPVVREADVAGLWRGPAPQPRRADGPPFAGPGGPRWFLSLFTEGLPSGFLLFGGKLSGEEIGDDEREFLSTLATQAALAIRHVFTLDETARMAEEFQLLNEVSRLFTGGNAPFAENLQRMWERLRGVLRLEDGVLIALEPGAETVALGSAAPDEDERERLRRWGALLLAETDRGPQLRRAEVAVLDGAEIESSFPAEFRPSAVAGRAFALLPLFYDGALEALLLLRSRADRALLQGRRLLLQHLSPTLSSALQKARDHGKLERLATTDGLTGLYNHRYFHDRLQQEYLRAYRLKDRVGLLLFDVDRFKEVNDAFGHVFGDEVLLRFAEVLTAAVREIDIPARYGGEEFAVILPQAGLEETFAVGERVRIAVEQALALRPDRPARRLTVSVGVAAYPDTASTKEKLVEAADRGLYLAKRAGRNRVVVAEAEQG